MVGMAAKQLAPDDGVLERSPLLEDPMALLLRSLWPAIYSAPATQIALLLHTQALLRRGALAGHNRSWGRWTGGREEGNELRAVGIEPRAT
ncbi:hypothetical protein BRADI_2g27945v3 [Brachypodium distachyon]|uniref:Uncharacterized protein n=1 Tax=Brachypodium distachyon TaxID=15368 RepID=A0A2K2DB28_BRADI|nr:hypothetical protein BRADI_2g27945v3 [Brachypodium distachyon]